MNIIHPTEVFTSPDPHTLAHSEGFTGFRSVVIERMIAETKLRHAAAVAAQISIRRKFDEEVATVLWYPENVRALRNKFLPEWSLADRVEAQEFHHLEVLHRALAAAKTRETGHLHWYANHGEADGAGHLCGFTRAVRPVAHQPAL